MALRNFNRAFSAIARRASIELIAVFFSSGLITMEGHIGSNFGKDWMLTTLSKMFNELNLKVFSTAVIRLHGKSEKQLAEGI